MALKPSGQAPVVESANVTCVRWVGLSRSVPFQQPAKSCTRWTSCPLGHTTYCVALNRLVVPEQVQWALEFAGPLVMVFASPVTIRRNRGMGTTLAWALPRNWIDTALGAMILPRLPSAPPPGWSASSPSVVMSRMTGQKYVDLSPNRHVVPAAPSDPPGALPPVDRLP